MTNGTKVIQTFHAWIFETYAYCTYHFAALLSREARAQSTEGELEVQYSRKI